MQLLSLGEVRSVWPNNLLVPCLSHLYSWGVERICESQVSCLCFVDGYRHVMMTGRSFEIFQCRTFYQVCGVFNSIILSLLFHHYENCQSTLSLFLGAVPGFFLLSFMYEAKSVTREVVHVCTSSATQIHCVSRSHKRCSGEQSWLSLQCRRFVAEQGAPSTPLPCPPLLLHTLSLLSFDQLFDSPHFSSFLCY